MTPVLVFSMEQLRRLDHIKQGQFTATITEEEEAIPPRFLTDIQDVEVRGGHTTQVPHPHATFRMLR